MTEEEKTTRLLDAQAHPERYSDEEIDQMLDEAKDVSDLKRALADEDARKEMIDVDDAWNRFEFRQHSARRYSLLKVAASVIGILFACAFAYAASVRLGIVSNPFHKEATIKTTAAEVAAAKKGNVEDTLKRTKPKETEESPKVINFDNEELQAMLSQIALFYHVKVSYANDAVRHIRLHFKWNQANSLDDVITLLNSFQQIDIVRKGDAVIVND